MKIEIISNFRNELLKRNEIHFTVDHKNLCTPSRIEIKEGLAKKLKADKSKVFIKKVITKRGSMLANGEGCIYDDLKQAKYVEPDYIIQRNSKKENKKE